MKIEEVYDTLAKFESRRFGFFRSADPYPIHKRLDFSTNKNYTGLNDLNDWILNQFPISNTAHILDAGCGVGKTLLSFCQGTNRTGLGISLSQTELSMANKAAKKMQLANQCSFLLSKFENTPHQEFDAIIAIESLKHTRDLAATLNHLKSLLKKGGLFIIVDDFPTKPIPDDKLKSDFMNQWSLTDLYPIHQFKSILSEDLKLVHEEDFTSFMQQKNGDELLRQIERADNRKRFIPFKFFDQVASIFNGGKILDYYYAKAMMKYAILVFEK